MSIEIEGATVGVVESVDDCGSIVVVSVREADGGLYRLHCDRRMYGHIVEAEGRIVGREVAVSGGFCEESIEFLD